MRIFNFNNFEHRQMKNGMVKNTKRNAVVLYRFILYTICVVYLSLLVLYSQLGYKHCRSTEKAEQYMALRGTLLPPDSELPVNNGNGTMAVTIVSKPWCLGTLNWVYAAKKAGVKNVLVINLGPGTAVCDAVKGLDVGASCVTILENKRNKNEDFGKTATFGDSLFFDIMTIRTAVIYELLQRGHDILFSDSDAIFLRNPLPLLELQVQEKNLDLLAQRDSHALEVLFDPICAGFMYFHNTERTRAFWKSVLSFVLQHPSRNDQKAVNMCGRDPLLGLNYDVLDSSRFPDGYRFFFRHEGMVPEESMEEPHVMSQRKITATTNNVQEEELLDEEFSFVERQTPRSSADRERSSVVRVKRDLSDKYIVHTNYIPTEAKIARMMDEGLWFLPHELSHLCGVTE